MLLAIGLSPLKVLQHLNGSGFDGLGLGHASISFLNKFLIKLKVKKKLKMTIQYIVD